MDLKIISSSFFIGLLALGLAFPLHGQSLHTQSWMSLGHAAVSIKDQHLVIQQSIGQSSVTGVFVVNSIYLSQGFLRGIRVVSTEIRRPFEAIAFPNSFSDHLTLRFTAEHQEVTQVQIHDAQGKLVYVAMHQPKNKEIQLHLPNLSAGIYVASLSSEKKFVQLRLIKKP